MEVSLNWLAIVLLTVFGFFSGSFWYGPLFGKIWMRMHYGDKTLSKEEMAKCMEGMWKIMVAELISTFMMVMTLAFLMKMLPDFSGMHVAFLVWFGFVLPNMVSSIIWGKDDKGWMPAKIFISTSYRLVFLLISAFVLQSWV